MEPFKNNISPELIGLIAEHLARHLKDFDRQAFEAPILLELPRLELKARAQLIADYLHATLPEKLSARHAVVRAMLHPDDDARMERQSDGEGICGWGMMPLGAVVGQHGLDDFEGSLELLKEMTKRFSSELDVRHYLLADQDRALNIMRQWLCDPNRHVRRLVSEGTRSRLPWAKQLPALIAEPAPILPLLEALRDDPEEYVRRSVANSLNDISKDHPDLVANLAREWIRDAGANQRQLLRHACRSLIKNGHRQALSVFGLHPPELRLDALHVKTPMVRLGGALSFTVRIASTAQAPQQLIIDYVLHFSGKNGRRSGKVFKWTRLTLDPAETRTLSRNHPIRSITTRRYYTGEQLLSLRINGQDYGKAAFTLMVEQ